MDKSAGNNKVCHPFQTTLKANVAHLALIVKKTLIFLKSFTSYVKRRYSKKVKFFL
jgi:hypothetical protein